MQLLGQEHSSNHVGAAILDCCFRSSGDRCRCVAVFLHKFGVAKLSIASAQMATGGDVAWILGDSHVFWLEKFVRATEVRYSGSLLECMDCAIAFHGYRGGTVASLEGNGSLRRNLASAMPSVVVLSVGGNDLDHAGTPQTLKIGMRLYEYAQALVTLGVKRVVVCQIVRRQSWQHISYEEGTARVTEVNKFLRAVCDDPHVSFWRHKGFWNVQRQIFRPDGVHFNDLGNHKLFRSIKGAVFSAGKLVHHHK